MNICQELIRTTAFKARTVACIENIVNGTAHVYIDAQNDRADVSIIGPMKDVFHYYENDLSVKLQFGLIDSRALANRALRAYRQRIFAEFYKK